jgi:hypothetical protein
MITRVIPQGLGACFALALLGSGLFSAPAAAAPLCGDRDQILEQLAQLHHEKPSALGLSADGGVLEILVSPEGGWTILVTYPKRSLETQDRPRRSVRSSETCVVAVGEAWEALQKLGQPA